MLQKIDGRTGVEYQITDKVPGMPPIVFGWTVHWPQMARFLQFDEETVICYIKDDEKDYEKSYLKSGICRVAVVNGFKEDRSERIMGRLCRLKTDGNLGKFTFYPGRDMSPMLLEAFYPDTVQRARIKLESELLPISDDGVRPWYFIGCQSHALYSVQDKIFLWKNGIDVTKLRIQDNLNHNGVNQSAQFLSLEALEGTDYAEEGIRDVDGIIHTGFVKRNHDMLEAIKRALTEEEFKALL